MSQEHWGIRKNFLVISQERWEIPQSPRFLQSTVFSLFSMISEQFSSAPNLHTITQSRVILLLSSSKALPLSEHLTVYQKKILALICCYFSMSFGVSSLTQIVHQNIAYNYIQVFSLRRVPRGDIKTTSLRVGSLGLEDANYYT